MARRGLRDALQSAEITVIAAAADGRETVELTQHYRPDVVLVDAGIPGIDGIEVTRRIVLSHRDVKVILLTLRDDEELGLSGLRAGAVGCLSKAVDWEAIPRAVRGVCRGEAAVSRGLTMRLIEFLRVHGEQQIGLRPVTSPLTSREWEVLDLLCADRTTDQIADQLVLSIETVRSHVRNILRKLGVRSRREAIARSDVLRSPSSPGALVESERRAPLPLSPHTRAA